MPLVLSLQSLRFLTAAIKNKKRQSCSKVMYFLPQIKISVSAPFSFLSSALLLYLNMRLSLFLCLCLSVLHSPKNYASLFCLPYEVFVFTDSKTRVYILKTPPQ